MRVMADANARREPYGCTARRAIWSRLLPPLPRLSRQASRRPPKCL